MTAPAPHPDEFADELIAEARTGGASAGMPPWMAATVGAIDGFSRRVGLVVCWMTLPVFLAMVYEIFVRYAFTAPTLWAYDFSRMMCGAMFMLGAGHALMRGVHIRADFLYRHWPARVRGTVDAALYLALYFPALVLFFWFSGDYFLDAFNRGERVDDTAWRPLAWPARAAMPLGAALLIVQGVSETLKAFHAAATGDYGDGEETDSSSRRSSGGTHDSDAPASVDESFPAKAGTRLDSRFRGNGIESAAGAAESPVPTLERRDEKTGGNPS